MARIRYRVAMSLDGYIAGPKGEFDWIVRDPDIEFEALFAQFDTFLVGRHTFELMLKPGSPTLPSGSKTFVFSRTLQTTNPGTEVIREVSPAAIARIRAQAKKDIWLFGGGQLFRSLLSHALVDSIEVAISPVLLGKGLQLLPSAGSRANLRLTSHHVSSSGIVLLEYAVTARDSLGGSVRELS
ncbi:MAG TPA: dihydrofolate reductase family protein [Steroidobacteraceae bacterium]